MSSSEPAHHTPSIFSRGKPLRCAVLMATEFITPQPHRITWSGLAWRICSHCDCCSLPGGATAILISSKPCCLASSSSTGKGSLPNAESWYRCTIFLPFSLAMPPFLSPRYLIMAAAWFQ
ncbi:hypothetical protein D9M69_696170 [compost metagenome]